MEKVDYVLELKKVKEWVEENGHYPKQDAENEEERRAAKCLYAVRSKRVASYLSYKTEEDRRKFCTKYPDTLEIMAINEEIEELKYKEYVDEIYEMKNWIDTHDNTEQTPKEIFIKYTKIQSQISRTVKRYLEIGELKNYTNNHPKFKELMELIIYIEKKTAKETKKIDDKESTKSESPKKKDKEKTVKIKSKYIENLQRVKKWMEDNNKDMPPKNNKDASEEERQMAQTLTRVRTQFVKIYLKYETEEERQKFIKKHPELPEVLALMQEIDKENDDYKIQINMPDLIKQCVDVSTEKCDEASSVMKELLNEKDKKKETK